MLRTYLARSINNSNNCDGNHSSGDRKSNITEKEMMTTCRPGCRDLKPPQLALPQAKHELQVQQQP